MDNVASMIKSRIDPTFNSAKTTWTDIYRTNKLFVAFLETHTRKERYHLEMFKCGKDSCKICKEVRMPKHIWDGIKERPRFIPLPISRSSSNNENSIIYQDYNTLKHKIPTEIHRPSYKMKCNDEKLKKISDNVLSKKTKPTDEKNLPNSLWHTNNIRFIVKCQNCTKPRCIFAWKIKNEDMRNRINDLISVIMDPLYNYICGDTLFGFDNNQIPHPPSTNIFHVRTNLFCYMPMEKLYYSNKNYVLCPRVCSICGLDNEFVECSLLSEKAEGKACRPMCLICFNDGADPMIYGRCKVKIANKKRGPFYEGHRKYDLSSKEVTHKRKNDDTPDKLVKKNLRDIEIIEVDKVLEKNTNNGFVFFQTMGIVIDFHEFGSIIDVPKDGNCGYHSFLLGLINIDGNLKKTITNLRFELYEHGVLSLSKLKKSPIYGAMPCNNDIKAQNYWQNIFCHGYLMRM